jgi:hypothetical protein
MDSIYRIEVLKLVLSVAKTDDNPWSAKQNRLASGKNVGAG